MRAEPVFVSPDFNSATTPAALPAPDRHIILGVDGAAFTLRRQRELHAVATTLLPSDTAQTESETGVRAALTKLLGRLR